MRRENEKGRKRRRTVPVQCPAEGEDEGNSLLLFSSSDRKSGTVWCLV